ncbi:MAG: site-specific integrase [Candidatus Margulisbacteria bacterium]|nr:site-specific integrase [Candidatus Margulisiibacteriota bacterium]
MPTIKYINKVNKKTGKKHKYVYIVENYTTIDSKTNKKKYDRKYLESLGILNQDVSKNQAKISLARYMDMKQPLTSDITLDQLIEEFKPYYKNQIGKTIQERTYALFLETLKNFKSIKHKQLRKIDFSDIELLKDSLTENLANRTINISLTQLSKLFKYANKRGYISEIPIIESLKEFSKEIFRLSLDQVKLLLENANSNLKFYIYMMVFTGMRPNEFLKLRWDNVFLEEGFIEVISDDQKKKGRKIPIHEKLHDVLKENECSEGNVSPYANRHTPFNLLKSLGKKHGISVSPYSLRKTFASFMAEQEVSPFKIAKIMGHSNISTTYKYYVEIEYKKLKKELDKHPLAGMNFLN